MSEKSFGALAQTEAARAEAAAAAKVVADAALEVAAREANEAANIQAAEALAAAEEEQREAEKAAQEAEDQNNRAEVETLGGVREKLAAIRAELAEEARIRQEATRARELAERALDDAIANYKKVNPEFTLSVAEVLESPDFADFDDVLAVKSAQTTEEQASVSMVGTPELTARLASLGVEVRPAFDGETVESRDVSRAMNEREGKLETDMYEARFKIPSERDAVVKDIVAQYKPKIERLKIDTANNRSSREGTFEDVQRQLEEQLQRIPVCGQNADIKAAVTAELVKETILSKHKKYQEQLAVRKDHEAKLAAAEASKAKLPEYLAAINADLFGPIQERLAKLDDRVALEIVHDREFSDVEKIFSVNYRTGEITGVNTPDHKTLRSSSAMEKQLAQRGQPTGSDYAMEEVLERLDTLEGVSYDAYKARRSPFSFGGYLKSVVEKYASTDTVPNEYPKTEESYATRDAAFKALEDDAQKQAKQFVRYTELAKELKGDPDVRARQENDAVGQKKEALRICASRLAGDSRRGLHIEGGRVFDTGVQDSKERKRGERETLLVKGRAFEAERAALGTKPEGMFVGKDKKEKWDKESARIAQGIKDTKEEIESIDSWMRNTPEDVTAQLGLPAEVLANSEGAFLTAGVLSEAIYAQMEKLRPEVEAAGDTVRAWDGKRRKLEELQKGCFYEARDSFYY